MYIKHIHIKLRQGTVQRQPVDEFTPFTKELSRFFLFFSSVNPEKFLFSGRKKRNHKYYVTKEVFKGGQSLNTLSTSSPQSVTEGLLSGCKPFCLSPTSQSPGIHQPLFEIKCQVVSCIVSYLCP